MRATDPRSGRRDARASAALLLVALLLVALAAACGDDAASSGATATGATVGSTGASATSSTTTTTTGGAGGEGQGGAAPATIPYVYVGTNADKIFTMLLDRETGALSPIAEIDGGASPNFLAVDPAHERLFAGNAGSSEVSAFDLDPSDGTLTFVNSVSSEGSGPAYVAVDHSGGWVLVANYGGGTIASLAIEGDGSLGASGAVVSAGQNPHLIRQHPDGMVYVPCLGSEYVRPYLLDEVTGELTAPPGAQDLGLPPGSGPRHLDFHPTLPVVYVVNELDDSVVTATRAPDGTLTPVQTLSTLPGGFDPDQNTCADIHVTPDGRYLYASNRGHDSLAIFAVDAQAGTLTALGHQPTGGSTPRNFAIDPEGEILLVANQQSAEIVTFRIDGASGLLTELVTTPVEGNPAFVGVFTQLR